MDPQIDPLMRRNQDPLIVVTTNAKRFDLARRQGAKKRRPRTNPTIDVNDTISQSVSRIELCRLGRIPPKHIGDAEANRPKGVFTQPLSVNHCRPNPLLKATDDPGLNDMIYFGLEILLGRIGNFIKGHPDSSSFEDIEV